MARLKLRLRGFVTLELRLQDRTGVRTLLDDGLLIELWEPRTNNCLGTVDVAFVRQTLLDYLNRARLAAMFDDAMNGDTAGQREVRLTPVEERKPLAPAPRRGPAILDEHFRAVLRERRKKKA